MGGADKALLILAGQTLISRAVARLAPQVERLCISANGDPARFAETGLPVLADGTSRGPLSGVLSALDWAAPQGATHVVSVAVDTPFFPGDLVPCLLLAGESSPQGVALAESGGHLHPTFGLWPVGLREDLRAALARNRNRVRAFAEERQAAIARFPDERAFRNLNTAQDLALAEASLGPVR